MTYTGNVTVGGRADVRELPHLVVEKLAVGPFDNNSYLLRCVATGTQVLVDAAAEPARLLELIGDDGIDAVVTTHRHGDHWAALAEVVAATGARTIAHVDDAPGIDVPTDETVVDGATIRVGDVELTAVHLVGHTPGLHRAALRRPDRRSAPVHRRLPVPGRRRQHREGSGAVRVAVRRRREQALRPAPRRDVGLPRPRERHHARRRAAAPARSGATAAGRAQTTLVSSRAASRKHTEALSARWCPTTAWLRRASNASDRCPSSGDHERWEQQREQHDHQQHGDGRGACDGVGVRARDHVRSWQQQDDRRDVGEHRERPDADVERQPGRGQPLLDARDVPLPRRRSRVELAQAQQDEPGRGSRRRSSATGRTERRCRRPRRCPGR